MLENNISLVILYFCAFYCWFNFSFSLYGGEGVGLVIWGGDGNGVNSYLELETTSTHPYLSVVGHLQG